MRVILMTDLEGVAGVMNAPDWTGAKSRYNDLGKMLLTKEVNAAIDGFFAAGATEVLVEDGHGSGAIDITLLDPRAKLQRGWDVNGGYPFGLDRGFDVMAFVGQHPKAGTEFGHLCHTGNMNVLDCTINGISVGEFGQDVFLANTYGTATIFASGCLAFTKEAEALVEGIETVAVKEGVQPGTGDECTADEYRLRNGGAIHLHPEVSRKMIREGAERALRRYREHPESFVARTVSAPYTGTIIFREYEGQRNYKRTLENYDSLVDLLNKIYL